MPILHFFKKIIKIVAINKYSSYIYITNDIKMNIATRKTRTRFMNGNIDLDSIIFDIMADEYGMAEMCACEIDFSDAVFSDGFIDAVEDGSIPTLDFFETNTERINHNREYHHAIFDGMCYTVYFK